MRQQSCSRTRVESARAVIRAVAFATTLSCAFGVRIANAGTTWDGGGGANTNIDLPDNWDGAAPGQLPNLTGGTSAIVFGTGGSLATINTDVSFASVTLNRTAAFTIEPGGGAFVIRSVNGSTSYNLTMSSAAGGVMSINAPMLIDGTNTANRLLSIRNNSPTRTLDINGSIGKTASTTAGDLGIRFEGVAGSVTRLDGALSNIAIMQQTVGTAWGGDLVIGGNQTTTTNLTIAAAGSGTNPLASARLVLGESMSDTQSYGAMTLSNTVNVVIGGNVSITTLGGTGSGANGVSRISGTGTLAVNGGTASASLRIEGGVGLVKQSAGTLNLNGDKTYTGATIINGGAVNVPGTIASAVTINEGGTLNLTGASSAGVTVNGGGTLSGEGSIGGALTIGTGTATLMVDPSTSSAVSASSMSMLGSVVLVPTSSTTVGVPYTALSISGGFGSIPLSSFTAGRGDTLEYLNAGTSLVVTPGVATPLSLTWKGNLSGSWDTATTANWINGAAAERFYAEDAVTFDDTASNTNLTIVGGTVSPSSTTFNNSTQNYTIAGGSIGGSGTLTKNGSGGVTLSGPIANSGGLIVNAGRLVLGATSGTATGGIQVNGGELRFSTLAAINPAANSVTLSGGRLTYAGSATVTNDAQGVSINTSGSSIAVETTSGITWRIGGKVSGTGDWTKSGNGVLALGRANNTNPNNDFTGKVTVTAGTLDIRWGDSLGSTMRGTEVQSAILLIQNFGQINGSTVSVAEPLTFSGDSSLTSFSQEQKQYTNRFTGPIGVESGSVLRVSTAESPTSTTNTPTTLELAESSIVLGAGSTLAVGRRAPGYLNFSTIQNLPQTIHLDSSITGSGDVSFEGIAGSRYRLAGVNDYAGDTVINGGTVVIGSGSAVPSGSGRGDVHVNGGATTGGTLDLNGSSITINGLSGSAGDVAGRVLNNASATSATLTLGSNNATASYAGELIDHSAGGGTLAIRKVGSGVQTLSGSGSFSGGTTIEAGALRLEGAALSVALDPTRVTDIRGGRLVLDYTDRPSPVSLVQAALTAGFASNFSIGQFQSGTADASRGLGWIHDEVTSSLTVAYTLYGDSNLDRTVNFVDLLALARSYNSASTQTWATGDSNYDGLVNFSDLLRLARSYNASLGSTFEGDWALALAPEPTACLTLLAGGVIVMRRRRMDVSN